VVFLRNLRQRRRNVVPRPNLRLMAVPPALIMAFTVQVALAEGEAADDGAALYAAHCESCHERPETKAPPIETLRRFPFARILQSMTVGIMLPQAANLDLGQRQRIARWLAAEEDAKRSQWLQTHACARSTPLVLNGSENWGLGTGNARHVVGAGIDAGNVDKLELQWFVALPAVTDMRSQPVVAGDTVFLGGQDGRLLALDRASGCVRWRFDNDIPIRTALSLERTPDGVNTLFFADQLGGVYAVKALDGSLRWKVTVKTHPMSLLSGSFAYHEGRLFVPLSSFEVAAAAMPNHECCRSRGGVVALDAETGKTLWSYGTTANAEKTYVNKSGVQMWGPSGATVWDRPAVDVRRGLLYIGTGQNTSSPATGTSDAVIALDMKSGEQRWVFQALANDAWNAACLMGGDNCPRERGPDFDFGASPIFIERSTGDLVLAGQKSGDVFALDPDKQGAVVWQRKLSQGSTNGGIHHGMATDGVSLVVPVADPERDLPGYVPKPAVHSLSVADGSIIWSQPVSRGCDFDPAIAPAIGLVEMRKGGNAQVSPWPACSYYYGQSAPVTIAGELVYAAGLDGKLRIFSLADGKLLRTIETNRAYVGSNGVEGHGGAIDVAGPVIDGDQLFLVSGYGVFGQMPGNMLLVYRVPGRR
jgi:polyvinyl alcohol dehydrogenase (cytochrome)